MVFIYITVVTIKILLWVIQILMFCRAIISWLPIDENSAISRFLYATTEFVVAPMRYLFDKYRIMEGFPLDMPFLCTFMALMILRIFI